MKEKILELRELGLTYDEIVSRLGCSKSTVSYHCGAGQKAKSRIRQRKARSTKKGSIMRKLDRFLRDNVHQFKRGKNTLKTTGKASYVSFYDKINKNPKCYLTGRDIDLFDSKSYNLDHIVPRSKGGKNDLSNCGLTCRDANWAKSDMMLDEFIELCKEVCENFGYEVSK